MRALQFAIVFAVTLSLGFSFTPQVFAGIPLQCADPYPSSASGTGTPQLPRFVCNDTPLPATWFIPENAENVPPTVNDPNPRVPIGFDPNAGPWVKHLEVNPNDIQAQQVVQGYSDFLQEYLVVAPNSPAWTDWHEVIINQPGEVWEFSGFILITTFPPSNVIIQPSPLNEVWVDFDPPLQPGTFVNIIKEIVYFGPNPITSPPAFIEVWQYPTVAEERQAVAGETLSIDSTALILLGTQSTIAWLIPIVVSAAGIGLVLVRKRF